jgi:hypothetical protein
VVLRGGLSITRGILGGGAGGLKIETFLGPEMATSVKRYFKKVFLLINF